MISRKRRADGGVGAAVEQRLDVAAHRGERRPQLVRDVGDEVAADAIGAAQIGDVVQHDDGAAWRAGCDRALRTVTMTPCGSGSSRLWPSSPPRSAAPICAAMSGWRTISR